MSVLSPLPHSSSRKRSDDAISPRSKRYPFCIRLGALLYMTSTISQDFVTTFAKYCVLFLNNLFSAAPCHSARTSYIKGGSLGSRRTVERKNERAREERKETNIHTHTHNLIEIPVRHLRPSLPPPFRPLPMPLKDETAAGRPTARPPQPQLEPNRP